MEAVEVVEAWGDPNIKATHQTTFEITCGGHLTKRGDCIIGVRASAGASSLGESFKEIARRDGSRIFATLQVAGLSERVEGSGDSRLQFTNLTSLVVRKSDYVCGRTLMVRADKAACDLSRDMVRLLRSPGQKLVISLRAFLSEP